jgi:hypothetical protein
MSYYLLKIYKKIDNENNTGYDRKDIYIYNDLSKVIDKLVNYLLSYDGCYEMVWFGIDLLLERYQNNVIVESIDLHQYIVYELPKYPHIYFDPYNNPIVIDHNNDNCEHNDEYDEYFLTNVLNGDENVKINVRIEVPLVGHLTGRVIEKDDIIMVDNNRLHYGYNNCLIVSFFSDAGLSCDDD